MNRHQRDTVRGELHTAGATDAEAEELLSLAENLHRLRSPNGAKSGRRWVYGGIHILAMPSAYVLAGIVVGILTVAFAQAASPGSSLFPVQVATDNVASALHPQYREIVMVKRADQVKELVADHASSQNDMSAVADYTEVADKYRDGSRVNYAAFRYCESQLSQAAKIASPQVSQAIERSINSLDAT
jgi:hypothetical protein